MLSVGGCEIERDCSFETIVNLSHQVFGVLSATGSIVIVSLIASWLTFRMTNVNLTSCLMGCAPGGMSLMTLMAEEDPRSDMNFVGVAQTLKFTCVVVSVPFLAMHMLDENATAVAQLNIGFKYERERPADFDVSVVPIAVFEFLLPFAINWYLKKMRIQKLDEKFER